jgi:hypothetical protein
MNQTLPKISTKGPWSYDQRLPNGMLGGIFPFLIIILGIAPTGFGIFLANDVAWDTPFYSNIIVWLGFALMFFSVSLAIWIFFSNWLWTAPQFGIATLAAVIPCVYGFVFAPLISSVLYSQASIFAKCILLTPFLLLHISWGKRVARACKAALKDKAAFNRAWIHHNGIATVFLNESGKTIAREKGFRSIPSLPYVVLPFLLSVPMYIYGNELTRFFSIPFIPLTFLVIGSSTFLVFTSIIVYSSIFHFQASAQIVASTDEPVLIDMVNISAEAKAPKGS